MKKILVYKATEQDWSCGELQENVRVQEVELKEGETAEEVVEKFCEEQYNYLRSTWQYDDAPSYGSNYACSGNYYLEFEILEVREEPEN